MAGIDLEWIKGQRQVLREQLASVNGALQLLDFMEQQLLEQAAKSAGTSRSALPGDTEASIVNVVDGSPPGG